MLDEVLISKLKYKKIENASGIYIILNIITNKIYIGSSKKIRLRRNGHLSDLRRGTHQNNILQNSWNKHGEKSFVFIIIENCDNDILLDREQYYLDKYKTYLREFGYNLSSNSRHISNGISPQREKCAHGHDLSIVNNKRVCKTCHKNKNKPKLKTHCGAGHLFDEGNTGIRKRIGAHGNELLVRYCKKCEWAGYLKRYKKAPKREPLKFCRKGHEFTPDNTKKCKKQDGTPYRTCRLCNILKQRERRARKKTNE